MDQQNPFSDLVPAAQQQQANPFADLVPPPPANATLTKPAPPDEGLWANVRSGVADFLGSGFQSMGRIGNPMYPNMDPNRPETPNFAPEIKNVIDTMVGADETSRSIAVNRPDLTEAPSAGVGSRIYEGFMKTPEARRAYLVGTYGPENVGWYWLRDKLGVPTDRAVIRGKDGEYLFNPPGLDTGDVVGGVVSTTPEIVGSVGGGLLGSVAGPAGAIAGSSVLGQTTDEVVGRLFPENREAETLGAAAWRGTKEAAIDAALSSAGLGAAKVVEGAANVARAPFAKSAQMGLAPEFRDAVARLNKQGYDVGALASEGGAGSAVGRLEALLGKLPGSSSIMEQYRKAGDADIARFQNNLTQGVSPAAVGREVVGELDTQRKNLIIDREQALSRADELIAKGDEALAARQGPQMGVETAGEAAKTGLNKAREGFRAQAGALYDAARAAPGGQDAIVPTKGIRETIAEIRTKLPPAAPEMAETGLLDAGGKAITKEVPGGNVSQFAPEGLRKFLSGGEDLADTMTIDQAKQLRGLIDDALENPDVIPGVSDRYLNQVRAAVTAAMDEGVATSPSPELRTALEKANAFYRENIGQFDRQGVKQLYREPDQAGFVEANKVVPNLIAGAGKPGVIRQLKSTVGETSPEWAATRRAAWESILDSGRSQTLYGRKLIDADGLVSRLNQLDDETLKEMFGADAQQLKALAADVANRSKYLDREALSGTGNPSVLQQLRAAAVADDEIARGYRKNVIAPFLRGEDGAPAKMVADELIPFLLRKAAPGETRQIVARLPEALRKRVEQGAIADAIETSVAQNETNLSKVLRALGNNTDPTSGDTLAEILGGGVGDAGRNQAARASAILSPESRQALLDLAVITARRAEQDATNQAIGGLASGAAIMGSIKDPVLGAMLAARAAGLAKIVTNERFRKWATNTRRYYMSKDMKTGVVLAAPRLADVLDRTLAEDDDVQAFMDYIHDGESQVEEIVSGKKRPPDGAKSWEEYFSRQGQPQGKADPLVDALRK